VVPVVLADVAPREVVVRPEAVVDSVTEAAVVVRSAVAVAPGVALATVVDSVAVAVALLGAVAEVVTKLLASSPAGSG
jgi:hypothetical protein